MSRKNSRDNLLFAKYILGIINYNLSINVLFKALFIYNIFLRIYPEIGSILKDFINKILLLIFKNPFKFHFIRL